MEESKPPTDLSIEQAATILNVSKTYLKKLMDRGEVPFRKVGRYRRVPTREFIGYKAKKDRESLEIRRALTKEAQDMGGY